MYSVHKHEAQKLNLPGRDVYAFIGGSRMPSERMTVGFTEVAPETEMTPHVHDDKEEIIFVIEGNGEAVVGDSTEKLEPYTAVLFPIGVSHVVKNFGKTPMRFVFMFNPPNDFGGALS